MNGLIYIVAITFILAWLIGFFLLGAGEGIHVLLVISIGIVLFKIYQEEQIYK